MTAQSFMFIGPRGQRVLSSFDFGPGQVPRALSRNERRAMKREAKKSSRG